jgi:hypothetical protein
VFVVERKGEDVNTEPAVADTEPGVAEPGVAEPGVAPAAEASGPWWGRSSGSWCGAVDQKAAISVAREAAWVSETPGGVAAIATTDEGDPAVDLRVKCATSAITDGDNGNACCCCCCWRETATCAVTCGLPEW